MYTLVTRQNMVSPAAFNYLLKFGDSAYSPNIVFGLRAGQVSVDQGKLWFQKYNSEKDSKALTEFAIHNNRGRVILEACAKEHATYLKKNRSRLIRPLRGVFQRLEGRDL